MTAPRENQVIGWRELVGLPEAGIEMMRAKIDTGARTAALNADNPECFLKDGVKYVRFVIPSTDLHANIQVERPVIDEREVRNTSGVGERRLVISMSLILGKRRWSIETTLANREAMEFDLILGRTSIRRRGVLVDPGRSYLAGIPKRPGKKRVKRTKRTK